MERQIDRLELAKCTQCACFNLRKAARAITQLYDKALRPTGLRATQFNLFIAIKMFGSVTVTRLAKVGVIDRTTLTRNLKPLEKQGLIKVAPGKDRRVKVVTLTEKGNETLIKALPIWEKAQARVIEELGQERWSSMLTNLSEMVSITQRT